MPTAAERKAAKLAEEAAAAAAAEEKATADAVAAQEAASVASAVEAEAVAQAQVEAEAAATEHEAQVAADAASGPVVTESADELVEDHGAAANADQAEAIAAEAALVSNPESADAKVAAASGIAVAVAAAPLEAPETKVAQVNPIEQNSNPFDYQGADHVIAAFGDRYDDDSYIEAEDGQPFNLADLFEGPDVSGNYTSTVRLVEHSVVGPYGHNITQLVVGAGTPIGGTAKQAIEARLVRQAEGLASESTEAPAED